MKHKISYGRMLIGWWACCLVMPLYIIGSTARQEAETGKKYIFSSDWFSTLIPTWEKALQPYKGKEGIRYLEVGFYEGRSLFWMLDNILTHPSARATVIDITLRKAFFENLLISGAVNKVNPIKGRSQDALRRLQKNSFDIIYIDGSHVAGDVLVDAALSWPLLKDNGTLIFDDYVYKTGAAPLELRPQVVIDAFITAYRNSLETLHFGRQCILRKKADPAPYLSFGQYNYDWDEQSLYTAGQKERVPLSDKETELVRKLFMGRGVGEVAFSPAPEMLVDPDFIALKERLKLDFIEELKVKD